MSTIEQPVTADRRTVTRSFCLAVSDGTLRRALSAVGAEHGWLEAATAAPDSVLVTDVLAGHRDRIASKNRTVLVIEPTPYACAVAVRAVAEVAIDGVFSADEPDELAETLLGVESGRVTIPGSVLRLAAQMPELSSRQIAVVSAIIAGGSNAEIAQAVGLSHTVIKRELAALYRRCQVANRTQLAARGLDLGLHPRRRLK